MSRRSLVCDLEAGRIIMVPEGKIRPEYIRIADGPQDLLAAIVAEHLPPGGVLPDFVATAPRDERLAKLHKWAATALERQVADARRLPPSAAAKILRNQAAYQHRCGAEGEAQSLISTAMAMVAETRGMRGAFGAALNALASNAGCLIANGDGQEVDFEVMLEHSLNCWRDDLAALKSGKAPPGASMALSVAPGLEGAVPQGRA